MSVKPISAALVALLLLPFPCLADPTAPEDIPVYRLSGVLPEADSMEDAQRTMSMTINMMTVQTVRRTPEQGTWQPFCQGDCWEIPTVATFEPKNFGAELLTCETVRAGLAIATAAWAELQAGTTRLRELTEQLEAAQGTPEFSRILAELNAIIRKINELTARIRQAYPPTFKAVDRKVVFTWNATPASRFAGWPRNWVAQGLTINLEEATVRGYVWKSGQGQVTDLGGIEGLPSAVGRGLRFAMDSTPVQICSEGRDVQLAGYVDVDVGIYDEAFTAWKSNARTTVKAVLKGIAP